MHITIAISCRRCRGCAYRFCLKKFVCTLSIPNVLNTYFHAVTAAHTPMSNAYAMLFHPSSNFCNCRELVFKLMLSKLSN